MLPDEYRKMAEVEDAMWYFRALHRHVDWCLRSRLQPRKADVLDAGCGAGGLLRRLREAHPLWTLAGIDYSPLACDLARQRAGVPVEQASITALPFPDGRFDAITTCDVVCQVPDEPAALRECVRCLRPGGILVVTMPAYAWLYSYHDESVGNLRRYHRAELLALLRDAGLIPGFNSYWNTLPFPLAVAKRRLLPGRPGSSDVRLYPAPLEAIFNSMMTLEHAWLRNGWTLRFGCSLIAVGRKPGG